MVSGSDDTKKIIVKKKFIVNKRKIIVNFLWKGVNMCKIISLFYCLNIMLELSMYVAQRHSNLPVDQC